MPQCLKSLKKRCKKKNSPIAATNPYGRTKLYTEEILRDLAAADAEWQAAA
jgi:UDP-glucose 4-epimerase